MCSDILIKDKKYTNSQTKEELNLNSLEGSPDDVMLKVRPELFNEWGFEKNSELGLNVYEVTSSSHKKVWWQCGLGHEWETNIRNRSKGSNCPYCAGQKAWRGFNDMWTTNPELASMLANPNDGYRYMQSSGKKVDCKCKDCDSVIKNKSIYNVYNRGLVCAICSDKISFGEKVVFCLLNKMNINFLHDNKLAWSEKRRYDFYLPEYSTIIEVHGIQHYRDSFGKLGNRSFTEEQKNDELKENLAKYNGIKNYIIIDARESSIEWLKNSILSSDLHNLLNINESIFKELEININESVTVSIWNLWNLNHSMNKISKELSLHVDTIRKYLKIGNSLGKCVYNPLKANESRARNYRKVVKLTLDDEMLEVYNTVKSASLDNGFNSEGRIAECCKGKKASSNGYKWMYLDDYELHKSIVSTIES